MKRRPSLVARHRHIRANTGQKADHFQLSVAPSTGSSKDRRPSFEVGRFDIRTNAVEKTDDFNVAVACRAVQRCGTAVVPSFNVCPDTMEEAKNVQVFSVRSRVKRRQTRVVCYFDVRAKAVQIFELMGVSLLLLRVLMSAPTR